MPLYCLRERRDTFNKSELFFTKDVTRQEANSLVSYLLSVAGDREISFQIDRQRSTMILRMIGNDVAIKTTELDKSFAALELDLQKTVFTESNVRFELTDYKFAAQKIVDRHPLSTSAVG